MILLMLLIPYTSILTAAVTLQTIQTDTNTEFQTIEGFGAADAFDEQLLANHPCKEKIYDLIFKDMGMSILRFRNHFYSENGDAVVSAQIDTVNAARKRMADGLPKILLSAWSPPAELKSNKNTTWGTLAKEGGKFVYEKYGEWWARSLQWYASKGIFPEYVSIQNEPDWECELKSCYDGCHMDPTESSKYPSYSNALEAASAAMKRAKLNYKLIGPETITGHYLENYTKTMNLSLVWGLAHHDYFCTADSCIDMFKQLESDIQKPLMMTEYYTKSWMETALIVHSSLTVENVVAYVYWGIPWPMGKRDIGTPGHPCEIYLFCLGSQNYTVNRMVYALMQYARFVRPGWKRVQALASSGDSTVKASAFKDPLGSNFTVVLINSASEEASVTLDGISIEGFVYQTSANQTCEHVGPHKPGCTLILPGQSITTVNGFAHSAPSLCVSTKNC